MEIRVANSSNKKEIVRIYQKSQAATGIPDPRYFPTETLGKKLYERNAIERFVAIEAGKIVGHALIEQPNPENVDLWLSGTSSQKQLIEMGGAFVDPEHSRQGIWTEMLAHRLELVKGSMDSIPVTATWSQNEHVKRTLRKFGGAEVAVKQVLGGQVSLFIFE